MALSIKTPEADRMARELVSLTGRSMTAVVTEALQEKLERERERRPRLHIDRDALATQLHDLRRTLDLTPVSKAEYDALTED